MPNKTNLTAHEELVQFILTHAEAEPLSRRIRLLRATANIMDEVLGSALLTRVKELEDADHRCREFTLRISGGAK